MVTVWGVCACVCWEGGMGTWGRRERETRPRPATNAAVPVRVRDSYNHITLAIGDVH